MVSKYLMGGEAMTEKYRVVKVSYSEELSSDSELWFKRFIEKALLDHITKDDYRLQALLISKNNNLKGFYHE
jgi:hypothetical protein